MSLKATSLKARTRASLVWAHRWFGLTLGLVFAVVATSGSLLLFQPQFFKWAHAEMLPANLSAEMGSIDRWVEKARAAAPDELAGPSYVWAPHVEHNESDAGMLLFEGLEPGGMGRTGLLAVLVAPDSGDVLGMIEVDHSLAYAPIFLHRNLWAGEAGAVLIGIMAVGAVLMLPVGLYLWWPSLSRLRRKLSPRPWRITFARAAGLHEWVGAWTVVILVPLVATGLFLVRPGWVEPLLGAVAEAPESGHARPTGTCNGPMTFDTAIERAGELAPPNGRFAGLTRLDDAWEVAFVPAGGSLLEETHVLADLACGTVAVESAPATRSPREALEMWLVSLHDGTVFGLPGQLLVTLVGFAPLVLLWSGVRMWFRRSGWVTSARGVRPVHPRPARE